MISDLLQRVVLTPRSMTVRSATYISDIVGDKNGYVGVGHGAVESGHRATLYSRYPCSPRVPQHRTTFSQRSSENRFTIQAYAELLWSSYLYIELKSLLSSTIPASTTMVR